MTAFFVVLGKGRSLAQIGRGMPIAGERDMPEKGKKAADWYKSAAVLFFVPIDKRTCYKTILIPLKSLTAQTSDFHI